jgi:hypothetical protein
VCWFESSPGHDYDLVSVELTRFFVLGCVKFVSLFSAFSHFQKQAQTGVTKNVSAALPCELIKTQNLLIILLSGIIPLLKLKLSS